jgi:hypothetical protein
MPDSYCGIYCGACLCNIVREAGNIEQVAHKLNRTIEQLTCTECKTAMHQDCCFVACCTEKGFQNCSECEAMPCQALSDFTNDGMKHHAVCIPNLLRIREIGLVKWLDEQKKLFTCPECGARTGWSYQTCDQCGHIIIKHLP